MSTPPFNWSEFEAEFEAEFGLEPNTSADSSDRDARQSPGLAAPDDPRQSCATSFTPVPRLRARRRGWSEGRQRAFIFALSRCGSVARAARAVGMSPRSAYQLLDAPGADDFARAWDQAIDEGVERVRSDAMQRALGGVFVPVYRRGKVVRVEHRQSDALAIALLGGREQNIDCYRRTAAARRAHRQDLAEHDRQQAEEQRRRDQVWAEHQAVLDRLETEKLLNRQPRVRAL